MIHQKEEWFHDWYLWKTVKKKRRQLKEENKKFARTVQELQHRLDETTEGRKPMLTDFTTLANELQRRLRFKIFSTVTSDNDKSNVLTEGQSVSDDVCMKICLGVAIVRNIRINYIVVMNYRKSGNVRG